MGMGKLTLPKQASESFTDYMRALFYFLFSLLPVFSLFAQEKVIKQNDQMYNARYGEIIVVTGGPLSFIGHVYNTIGLNECPDSIWKALDAKKIKKERKARAVTLNGPRYFLMDQADALDPGKVTSFHGLQARHIADLKIPLSTVIQGGSQPYFENLVLRRTNYLFKKGRTIYELTSPNGVTYVMQSYPQQKDPNFTVADLAKIGNRLSLPAGWHFHTRILDQDFAMKATGKAYVIRDNLQNSYQKE